VRGKIENEKTSIYKSTGNDFDNSCYTSGKRCRVGGGKRTGCGAGNIIGNQYVEFCVAQDEWNDNIKGRFTIGTVGGSPNYTSDADLLREMSKNSDIAYVCIDAGSGDTVTTRITDGNDITDMMPRLAVADNQVYALWYSNSDNDILKQGGRNQICMTEVMYTDTVAAVADDSGASDEIVVRIYGAPEQIVLSGKKLLQVGNLRFFIMPLCGCA